MAPRGGAWLEHQPRETRSPWLEFKRQCAHICFFFLSTVGFIGRSRRKGLVVLTGSLPHTSTGIVCSSPWIRDLPSVFPTWWDQRGEITCLRAYHRRGSEAGWGLVRKAALCLEVFILTVNNCQLSSKAFWPEHAFRSRQKAWNVIAAPCSKSSAWRGLYQSKMPEPWLPNSSVLEFFFGQMRGPVTNKLGKYQAWCHPLHSFLRTSHQQQPVSSLISLVLGLKALTPQQALVSCLLQWDMNYDL